MVVPGDMSHVLSSKSHNCGTAGPHQILVLFSHVTAQLNDVIKLMFSVGSGATIKH